MIACKSYIKGLFCTAVAAVALLLTSCEADKINPSGDIKLSFSTECLSFDTIFTAQGSATKKFKIYNTCKNKVVMSSVGLVDGSKFEMNLDGRKGREGTSFSDITINAQDSMVVFVQVNIDPNDSKTPFIVRDSIRFLTNGNEQFVRLEAYGRNAKRFSRHTISVDTTLTNSIAFLILDTLRVPADRKLTVTDGATLYFRKNAVLIVDGTLEITGSQSVPVTLRGERSDYMNTTPPLNYDNSSNQWGGVRFTATSKGNKISFANIRNSSFGLQMDSLNASNDALLIENSTISNSGGNLISTVNADVKIYNSLLYSAGGNILKVTGGSADVKHCTIANYYSYTWGSRTAANVNIATTTASKAELPVTANFYNTIIYGGYTNEVVLTTADSTQVQYLFKNCLVKQKVKEGDTHYVECNTADSPKFIYESWTDEYKKANPHTYDFHLQDTSPAIGRADYSVAQNFPTDLDGNNRLHEESADMGCYTAK